MKVRMLDDRTREEREVLEVSEGYYIVPSRNSAHILDALPKAMCEVVPDVSWVNVTEQCEARPCAQVHGGMRLWHGDVIVTCNPNYRIRKMRVIGYHGDVLIVERLISGVQPH